MRAQAIHETTILLENIERTSLNSTVIRSEITRNLDRVINDIAVTKALDVAKGKALDLAGKLRNEAVHQQLAFLEKQAQILHDAQYGRVGRVVDAAREEGIGMLAVLDRQLEHQGLVTPSPTFKADTSHSKKQPNILSDRMRINIAEQAKKGKRNAFPVDMDSLNGLFPDDNTVMLRMRPVLATPVVTASPSSFFSKALGLGVKGLKVLPLVGELWTRKENALLASAHALTESCISNQKAGAGTTAGYILGQYAYRGFGFLSLVLNLAETADAKSMQDTLNFLLNAGCFDEYREFVDNNKGIFSDLGLSELQIASSVEISQKETEYMDMRKRLNTPRTMEELAANRKADNEARARDLMEKKATLVACCGLLTAGTCPRITNNLGANPVIPPNPTDRPIFPLVGDSAMPAITCSQLQADINRLESRLIVP